MRLKSLTIQGFKSFPDKTHLEFDDGITAVVGPNGSGKSNIADAVRWVLGEQSTRALRGGKMEDVIFNGTQYRTPMGVAAVTLVIDNTSRELGFDGDEVALTRRLYRSGESEYRLNSTPVRLRDINELLMDTGLGKDGYSIIGQGRVAEMVSGRAQDRREIFEEAAGISKFRYRKAEAQRRLDMAEENMIRLRDIMSELEERVEPLRRQSEKAKKFLELAQEKKLLEVSLWMHNLGALRIKASQAEDSLLLTATGHGQAEQEAAGLERELEALGQKQQQLNLMIEQKRDEKTRCEAQAAELESKKLLLENDIGHHQKSIAQMEMSIGQAADARRQTDERIKSQTEQMFEKQAGADLIEQQIREAESERQNILQEQARCAQRLEELRLRRTGFFQTIEEQRLTQTASTTMLSESQAQEQILKQAVDDQTRALEEIEAEKHQHRGFLDELAQKITSLDNAAAGCELKLKSRGERFEQVQRKAALAAQKLQASRQRSALLMDMEKNLEGFAQSVRALMKYSETGLLKGVEGPVSSLLRCKNSEHTQAIETALGGAMQNIVVKDEAAAKRGIALLKQNQAGRATFLPISSVRGGQMDDTALAGAEGYIGLACDLIEYRDDYRGIMEWLLGKTAVARDIDCAVAIAKSRGYSFRVVTLDGQLVNAGGSMTGGSAVRAAGILARRDEIARLNRLSEELKTEHENAQREAAAAKESMQTASAELDAVLAERKSVMEDHIRCEAEIASLERSLSAAKGALKGIYDSRQLIVRRIEQVSRQSQSAQEAAERMQKELDELQAQIADAAATQEADTQKLSELAEKTAELNTGLAILKRDEAALQEELSRLVMQRDSDENMSKQLAGEKQDLEQAIQNARYAVEEGIAEAAGLAEKAEEFGTQIAGHIDERLKIEKQSAETKQAIAAAAAQRDELYREMVRLEEHKKALDTELTSVVARLYDEYEMTRTQAEEMARPIDDEADSNARLTALRQKIRALGSVNVAAIEEYTEVYERYSSLTVQMQDIEKSKVKLERLITELTDSMRSIFADRFERISRMFSEVFAQLFGGGSASLSLADPNDVLESPIEISARPPGKVIKNLASLSGGEESLVAIAIYFSILKVNPSPFCLLDEIEASLDDVNVVRFADYLRTMADKTQFIAITHRRGTMEEADVLYGVTMQEKGVSRLLRLNVAELDSQYSRL